MKATVVAPPEVVGAMTSAALTEIVVMTRETFFKSGNFV